MNRLVVKPHSPLRQRLTWALTGLALLAAGWGLYAYGHHRAGLDFEALGGRVGEQLTRIDELEVENERLRGDLAIERRSREIESEAYKRLETSVGDLQAESLQLREELAFFRGIVSPLDGRSGLTLAEFDLAPREGVAGGWHYKLVLTQVLKNDAYVSGKVRLTLKGRRDGEEAELGFKELGVEGDSIAFRFRYFQTLEGDIQLPEGFQPATLVVVVDPRGKLYNELTHSYDWPAEEN